MSAYKHVIVASHPRSGTHLTIDSLRLNFNTLGDDFVDFDCLLPMHKRPVTPEDFRAQLARQTGIPILKTHVTAVGQEFTHDEETLRLAKSVLDTSKIIYVFRDGRDVLTSLYCYQQNLVPPPPKVSFAEFLRTPSAYRAAAISASGWPNDLTSVQAWARHVSEWLDSDRSLPIGYEEWSADPAATLQKVARYLELPPPASVRRAAFQRPSFLARLKRKLTGKQLESSAVLPRKGVVGDWVNYFSKDDEDLFWDLAGSAMQRLGYHR